MDELFESGRLIKISAGEVLHDVHDSCTALGKVVSGRLHLSRLLSSGREIIMKEFLPGEIYAELIVFTGDNFPGWLIAAEDSEVIEVDREKLLEQLKDTASLISFISGINEKMMTLADKIEILSLKTVVQKVSYCILTDGALPVGSITKTADKLGCSREALSRAITELEQSGAVVRRNGMLQAAELSLLEDLF